MLCALLGAAAGFALHSASRSPVAPAAVRATAPLLAEMPGSASKITPLQDYVLVDLQSVPSATDTGILLPTVFFDEAEKNEESFIQPKPRAGTIVAIGPGRRSNDGNVVVPMPDLKVGMKVVVGADQGERVILDGETTQDASHYLFKVNELFGNCDLE